MLAGLSLWVWNWDDRCIALARHIGAKHLLIKAADGNSPWLTYADAAAKCEAAGIHPVPWAYNYGDPGECATLKAAAPGATMLILDPEIEYEQRGRLEQAVFNSEAQLLRDAGITVGCACWARPEVHAGYNFAALGKCIDFWLPMVAWADWIPDNIAAWLDHWDTFDFGVGRTVPWLPCTNDGGKPLLSEDVLASVNISIARYGGASIWAAHTINALQEAALATDSLADADFKQYAPNTGTWREVAVNLKGICDDALATGRKIRDIAGAIQTNTPIVLAKIDEIRKGCADGGDAAKGIIDEWGGR